MKTNLAILLSLITLSSCSAIEGIFKAGMGVGIFIVVFIIVLIVLVIMRFNKKS